MVHSKLRYRPQIYDIQTKFYKSAVGEYTDKPSHMNNC